MAGYCAESGIIMTQKLGFACKFIPMLAEHDVKQLNATSTTVAWLNRQTRDVAENKLWDIAHHNCDAYGRVFEIMATWPEHLRMIRLGSEMLPVYTEATWSYFWQLPHVKTAMAAKLKTLGDLARKHDIRVSFHPGQFCCVVSDRPDVVERSIEELEYHAAMVCMMGYGKTKLDCKINVHLSGRLGPDGFNAAWKKMSPELRMNLTLENDEYQSSLDDILPLGNQVGIVLDIHHHLIKEHTCIKASDDRIQRIKDSWCGQRPVFHYSVSSEHLLKGHCPDTLLDIDALLNSGYKKQKLRAHSDMMWNNSMNDWAYTHLDWADCMVESKLKNISTHQLFEFWE